MPSDLNSSLADLLARLRPRESPMMSAPAAESPIMAALLEGSGPTSIRQSTPALEQQLVADTLGQGGKVIDIDPARGIAHNYAGPDAAYSTEGLGGPPSPFEYEKIAGGQRSTELFGDITPENAFRMKEALSSYPADARDPLLAGFADNPDALAVQETNLGHMDPGQAGAFWETYTQRKNRQRPVAMPPMPPPPVR